MTSILTLEGQDDHCEIHPFGYHVNHFLKNIGGQTIDCVRPPFFT